jgi:hypothetical protein
MENIDYFKKEVEEGSLIRYEINEDHAPILSKLSKIYKGFFNRDPGEFRYAKDMWYYKGGWPSPNTPPRAKNLAKHIATSMMILHYIGKDNELNEYLKEYGFKIEFIDETKFYNEGLLLEIDWKLDNKRKKLVEDNWKDLFGTPVPSDPKELLSNMMNLACNKQKVICELADQIKIDKGQKVEEECKVKVGDYTRAVNLKYKLQKGNDITPQIDRIVGDSETTIESVETLVSKS